VEASKYSACFGTAHDEAAKGLLQEITLRKKQPQRAAKDAERA